MLHDLSGGVADDLSVLFRRFVSTGDAEVTVLALWTMHTHAFGVSYYTEYLEITSPEKQSGKTRTLEVLNSVVREPQFTASISPAALARTVGQSQPTLLLDELDALLKGDKEMSEAVRGILNSGFQADGAFTRMVGVGAAMKPEQFSTFSPKAMAGIGTLPDTLADRSITIRLERSPRGTCEKFRPRGMGAKSKQLQKELTNLKNWAAEWATQNHQKLADAEPQCPTDFSDRQQDISEPLLAIADLIGGAWPTKARSALLTIFTSAAAEDQSPRTQLLSDIKDVFDATGVDKLTSEDLIAKLTEIETSPWGEWRHGKPMSARGLAEQLKPFNIGPRSIRFQDDRVKRGYQRETFSPLWTRYVADRDPLRSGSKSKVLSSVYAGCSTVADKKGGTADGGGLPSCGKCGSYALYLVGDGKFCQTCGVAQ
jgi:hypothetical protein